MAAPTITRRPLPGEPVWLDHRLDEPIPAPPAGEPGMLGLSSFIVGAVAFGLVLIGVFPAVTAGAALPIIIAASLGLFLATIWAARIGENAPAGIFGVVAGFFLSYAMLVLGLTHGWFGIAPTAVADTQKMFVISWMVIVTLLVLVGLRLPKVFLALFMLVDVALLLDLLGIINGSANLTKAAGWVTMAFAAVAVYLFVGTAHKVAGGKEFPLGKPLLTA